MRVWLLTVIGCLAVVCFGLRLCFMVVSCFAVGGWVWVFVVDCLVISY